MPSIAVARRNDCLTPNDALVADLKWRIGRPEKNTAPVVIPFICARFAGRIPNGHGERLAACCSDATERVLNPSTQDIILLRPINGRSIRSCRCSVYRLLRGGHNGVNKNVSVHGDCGEQVYGSLPFKAPLVRCWSLV